MLMAMAHFPILMLLQPSMLFYKKHKQANTMKQKPALHFFSTALGPGLLHTPRAWAGFFSNFRFNGFWLYSSAGQHSFRDVPAPSNKVYIIETLRERWVL